MNKVLKSLRKLISCIFLVGLMVLPNSISASQSNLIKTNDQIENEINALIDKMSLETKIGQLFIFGFSGKTINKHLARTLKTLKPGAIIVFGHNINSANQIARLNYQAQNLAIKTTGIPLLIAVDQEGGEVIRIKTSPPLPSALSIGRTKSAKLAERAGFYTGELLRTLGFNMNLAPVLDVADPNKNSFIGTRSFSYEPEVVSIMGNAFAKGLLNAGILPTAKHFPGHGGVEGDSHISLLQKTKSLQELLDFDLLPFKKLSTGLESSPAIMVAHIAYPSVDPTRTPATYSSILIDEILRKQLGFNGMVVTDDIEMSGASKYKNVGERAVRAIEAGNDLVMVVWSRSVQRGVVKGVKDAIKSGRLTMNRIDESVRRILMFKKKYISFDQVKAPSRVQLTKILKSKGLKSISDKVTLFNLKNSIKKDLKMEVKKDQSDVLVFSASGRFFNGLRSQMGKRKARFYRLKKNLAYDINRVLNSNPLSPAIYFVSGPQSAWNLRKVNNSTAKRLIIVNTRTRGQLPNADRYRHVIDVHTKHPELGRFTGFYLFKNKVAATMRAPASPKKKPLLKKKTE